jgi:hypothetical protein
MPKYDASKAPDADTSDQEEEAMAGDNAPQNKPDEGGGTGGGGKTKQGGTKTGVTVSEEYQQHAHKVTHKASKHELSHLRSKINERDDELRQEEREAEMATKGKEAPSEFNTSDMPAMD